jgi:hypothetical protein
VIISAVFLADDDEGLQNFNCSHQISCRVLIVKQIKDDDFANGWLEKVSEKLI